MSGEPRSFWKRLSEPNEYEAKAIEWLKKQGYDEAEIRFDPMGIVDIVARGEYYEVKTLHNDGSIKFSRRQIREFQELNPTIIVFKKGEHEPINVLKFSELEKHYKIKLYRKSTLEVIKLIMEELRENPEPHTINQIAQKIYLDYKTVKQAYEIFKAIAKYRIIPTNFQSYPKLWLTYEVLLKPYKRKKKERHK